MHSDVKLKLLRFYDVQIPRRSWKMSGYKRVNFYELCRLCASNQQKEKTHIFQEEGRKIQLQTKIQSCLSLKVCENDFLPKVVCSQCLHNLEESYTFRNECISSETMLSSYFNNFRYTDDFKKSGKVYIKDTTPKSQQATDVPTTTQSNSVTTSGINTNFNGAPKISSISNNHDNVYPLSVPQQPQIQQNHKSIKTESKPISYNLNTINLEALKSIIPLGNSIGNIAVNSNGEILNITPLIDLESIVMSKPSTKQQKVSQTPSLTVNKKKERTESIIIDGNVLQIDLGQAQIPGVTTETLKYDKLPHMKSTPSNKYTYTVKVQENMKTPVTSSSVPHQNVLMNRVPLHVTLPSSTQNFNQYNSEMNSTGTLNNWNYHHQNVTASVADNLNMNIPSSMSDASGTSGVNFTNVTSSSWSFAPATTTLPVNVGTTSSDQVNISNTTVNVGVNDVNPSSMLENANSDISSSLEVIQNLQMSAVNNKNTYDKKVHIPEVNTQALMSSAQSMQVNSNEKMFSPGSPSSIGKDEMKRESSSLAGKSFPCDVCQKVFKRREHLYQHIKLHTGFRPFVCENCNKSFMRKEHLMRHMTSHSGLKNFMCNICEKSFSRNDNLLKHKKTHEKQTSFTCEICQKQFVMKHYYQAHKMTHDTDKCQVPPLWNVLKT